jgi:predicted nucleic acid-binding protein
MNRETIYLDTSVPSAYFDERNPGRMQKTKGFWIPATQDYELVVSEVTLFEIGKTTDSIRREEMFKLIEGLTILELSERAKKLSDAFIDGNLVPASKREDAQHLAIAVENGLDLLVSWNFSHMVSARTQKRLPEICAAQRYFKQLLILTPESIGMKGQP